MNFLKSLSCGKLLVLLTISFLFGRQANAQLFNNFCDAFVSPCHCGTSINHDFFAQDAEILSNGNFLIGGYFLGGPAVDFAPGAATQMVSGDASIVAIYSPANIYVNGVIYGSNVKVNSVAEDALGNILVYGWFSSSYDFNPGVGVFTLSSANGNNFVVKLTSSLGFLWAKQVGGGTYEAQFGRGRDLLVGPANDIYLGGPLQGTSDTDPGPGVYNLTAQGYADIQVIHLDAAGNFISAFKIVGGFSKAVSELQLAPNGDLIMAGSFEATTDFDPSAGVFQRSPVGGFDMFLACYSPTGQLNWVWSSGYAGYDMAETILIDPAGNIYLGGARSGPPSYLMRFNGQGTLQWTKTPNYSGVLDLQFDSTGNIWAAMGALNSLGAGGAAIARYATTGAMLEISGYPLTYPSTVSPVNMVLDQNDEIWIFGSFFGGAYKTDIDPSSTSYEIYSDSMGRRDAFFINKCSRYNNAFSGQVYYDLNQNNLRDSGEPPAGNILMRSNPMNYYAISDGNGAYWARALTATNSITISSLPPIAQTFAPANHSYVFPNGFFNVQATGKDFALTVTPGIQDLGVSLQHYGRHRPGRPAYNLAVVTNHGTDTANAILELVLANGLNVNSTSPIATSVSGDTMRWVLNNLLPFQSRAVHTTSIVDSNLVNGWPLVSWARVLPLSGDLHPADNQSTTTALVTTSWDPNYKSVSQVQMSPVELSSGQFLTYMIHFQNTGNDTAFNVRVLDTISNMLGLGTIEVLASSHPYTMSLQSPNVINWRFTNILLPDSATNENGSQGYLMFRIRPNSNLTVGTVIRNRAAIYFDYNLPVNTGYAETSIRTIALTFTVYPETCADAANGMIHVGVSGGTPPYSLRLNGGAPQSSQWFTNLTDRKYRVQVTDFLGVSVFSDSLTVIEPIRHEAMITSAQISNCVGVTNAYHASTSLGTTYDWNVMNGQLLSGQGTPNAIVNWNQAGPSSIVLTVNAATCPDSDTINTIIFQSTDFDLGADTATCAQALSVTGPISQSTYLWSTGATSPSIAATSSGDYWLQATDASGCTARDTIRVDIYPQPSLSLGPDTVACFDSLLLNASAGFASYNWSGGSTAPSIWVSNSGQYELQVADSHGCIASDTIGIVIAGRNMIDLGADTASCATPINVMGPISQSGYVWSTGAVTHSVAATASGDYWLQATNASGCTARDTIRVDIYPQPSLSLGPDTVACFDSLLVNASAGFATYNWSSGSTAPLIWVGNSGQYALQVADVHGCTASDTIGIVIAGRNMLDLGADTASCAMPINVMGPFSQSGYLWSTGAATPSIAATSSGDYWLQATNANGCTDRDTIRIDIFPQPSLTLGPDAVACFDSLLLNAGAGFSTYNWSGGGTTPSIWVSNSGQYALQVADVHGCTASDTIGIVIAGPNMLDLGADTASCAVPINVMGPNAQSNYLWSTGATTPSIAAIATGDYWLQTTDTNGCTARDTIRIDIFPQPSLTLGPDAVACFDSMLVNAAAGFSTYNWSGGGTTPSIWVSTSGQYALQVADTNGCMASDTIGIVIAGRNIFDLGADTASCDIPITLSGPASQASYLWSTGDTSSFLTLQTDLLVSLTVLDSNGCQAIDTIAVSVYAVPTDFLGADTALCNQSIVMHAPHGGQSYLWSTGGIADSISINTTGLHWVEFVDSNGCFASDSIQISLGSPVVSIVPAGPISLCDGQSITLNGPPGYIIYAWNGTNLGATLLVSQTDTLVLTVTDANGCIGSTPPCIVTVQPLPVASIFNVGDTLFASPQGSYFWQLNGQSTGQTGPWIVPTVPGAYSVVVTDSFGCAGISQPFTVVRVNEPIDESLTIWPNPSDGRFYLRLPSWVESNNCVVTLYDAQGRSIRPKIDATGQDLLVDSKGIAAGIYLLQFESQGIMMRGKIIVLGK